jgi:hypothetical protein
VLTASLLADGEVTPGLLVVTGKPLDHEQVKQRLGRVLVLAAAPCTLHRPLERQPAAGDII